VPITPCILQGRSLLIALAALSIRGESASEKCRSEVEPQPPEGFQLGQIVLEGSGEELLADESVKAIYLSQAHPYRILYDTSSMFALFRGRTKDHNLSDGVADVATRFNKIVCHVAEGCAKQQGIM